jgi:hypothetical protein
MNRNRRGVILLTAAGMIFVLLAFVGLALDVGYLQWSRRRAQTAADAAALAGGWAKQMGGSVAAEGRFGAEMNGFKHNDEGVRVTINNPYAGDSDAVEAIVEQDAPSFFMRALAWNTLPVRARAAVKLGYGTACVYALNATAKDAIHVSGELTLGCGAIAESTHKNAVKLNSAEVTMKNGATFASVGGFAKEYTDVVTPATSLVSGAAMPVPADPLRTLPVPVYTNQSCLNGSTWTMQASSCAALPNLVSGTYQPGVYCGGARVNNSSDSVSFAPGLYILAGGDLDFGSGRVTGAGVTFFLDSADNWPVCSNKGGLGRANISSQAEVAIEAPTSGAYAGVVIFQNRDIGAKQTPDNSINAGAGSYIIGALYFPNAELAFTGHARTDGYMMLIADTVKFTGGGTLTINNFPPQFATNNPAFRRWVTLSE